MIKDILILDNDTKSSINLNLDLKDKSKVDSYVVTSKSIEIISEILCSFKDGNKNKSKILIGPYGKGKSHLALYIMDLVSSDTRNSEKYTALLNKSREVGNDTYELVNKFMQSEDKYLPVVLNSTPYNKSFGDILVYSLKNALANNGIEDINLDFYFEKAVDKIDTWEEEYEITFKQFKELINEDVKIFKGKLESYDLNAYNKFKEIYKQLTAGEEFKPYIDIDPIKIYKQVSVKLSESGYKGIFILYDEFSKYIEYLVSQNSVLDIKLLQDFAEFCNRSKDNTQIHMILISHKSIGQYTDNTDKSSIDNWKAIEGRFDEINFNDFSNQQYEIISSAVKKRSDKWNEYRDENKEHFEELINNYELRKLFKDLSDEEYKNWIVYGSYPLHPLATYCLPRISERVAQNERTLFTFLCRNENNTLSDFVLNNNKEVKLDAIYDFFEDSIESLGKTDEIYNILKRANRVIQNLHDEIDVSIIKSIAIIHMINNFMLIKPDNIMIKNLYGIEGEDALQKLIKENKIIYRKLNDLLDISKDSDIEVFNEIKNTKENNSNVDFNAFLNETFDNLFIESKRHNDKNNIIRYFKVKFLGNNANQQYIEQDLKNEKLDGIIYITEKPLEIDENLDVIFIKNIMDSKQLDIIRDLYAIKKIKVAKNTEASIKYEIEVLEAQYENNILNYINDILQLKLNNTVYFKNEIKQVKNKNGISKIVTEVMDRLYYRTPIINNEMINKTVPSSVVLNARAKIIDQIIDHSENKNIVFRKGSLEATLIRSILYTNGAMNQLDDERYELNYDVLYKSPSNGFEHLIAKLNEIINESLSQEINLSYIYDVIMDKEYGFGVKRGVVPVILAYLFSKHKKYLSILEHGNEVMLNSETLMKIDKEPDIFTLQLEEFTQEKEVYTKELEKIFSQYINDKDKRDDNLNYIIIAIKRWFLYLNKYARNTKKAYIGNKKFEKLSKPLVKFKNRLRVLNENSIKFLFEDLLSVFEVQDYKNLIEKLKVSKEEIDNLTAGLYTNIENDIKNIFEFSEEASLNNALSNWKDNLNINRIHVNNNIGLLLDFIDDYKNLNNEISYLDKLSSCLLGIYISDWNEDTPIVFLRKIESLKKEAEQFKVEEKEQKNTLEIAITKEVELSNRAEMLLEDLKETLDDYSSSVSEDEKQYIILELLKHI